MWRLPLFAGIVRPGAVLDTVHRLGLSAAFGPVPSFVGLYGPCLAHMFTVSSGSFRLVA